jgi:hypothetical protein
MKRILGVDCGDVIFDEWTGVLVPDSLDALKKIVGSNHFEKIYIVSKAPPIAQIYFRMILRSLDFWEYTGIPREHLYFCNAYKDKAEICERLGITDFVDDRLQVLHHLDSAKVNRYALNARRRREYFKYPETARSVKIVESWTELSSVLLA